MLSAIGPPPNRPPLFTSLPVVDANVNTPYSYQATAEDPDGDPLTYSLGEAVTTAVVVTNSSFEAQVLSDGASTGALTGWTITGGTAAGTLNPGSAQYPGSAVTDGLNVAYSSGPTISQVLTERVTAGTRATSSRWTSATVSTKRCPRSRWNCGPAASSPAQSAQPANGEFATVTVAYDAPAGSPLPGQPLEIRLLSGGSQANFDNVRLTAAASTYPAGMTIDPQTGEIAWTPTASPVSGLPSVPGFSVEVYTLVEDPFKLSFDPSGVLYAGRDKSGSGGSAAAAVKVHRIGGGGSPVSEYGASPLPDPDAVLFDATGTVSGVPGSVLVGGEDAANNRSLISVIRPDSSVVTLFSSPFSSAAFRNPQDLVFDRTGRLLFTNSDSQAHKVSVTTGAFPTTLFTIPVSVGVNSIAVDEADRIYTIGVDGVLRGHDSAGQLLNGSFAVGLGSESVLAFGTGGAFGTYLYVITNGGDLRRYDAAGSYASS